MIPGLEGGWDRFCGLLKREEVLSPEAKTALQHIRDKIASAFEGHYLSFLPALDPTKKLMVRSSGDEDRAESANAGGNLSLPCNPEPMLSFRQLAL